ncbi:Glyoxalase/Bleomycin resistance protein/Dioxygenase superfamily protein [Amycolatopsis pretoriensis]|uniref:Glyoxalase/Bleomycin resistance protein/Dioxygenase superfamily protein n=1 Tax=Amycolatopsis pretoriensis TaxID=218821 RepID=A0A1H5RJG2_9PSEU|nr:VOC family protein [Amycolatopsis pretoriensis]SEF38489.1 Glyoxalase/Bleomycin resistance protein/Dioxygenase superfamily protein [Amycolatopsis pretoriensis]
MTRPRLRHLAFVVRDAESMAAFYVEQLGMDLFHIDPDGSRFVTDGYLNLALIQQDPGGDVPAGFNHFGFDVPGIAAVIDGLVGAGLPHPALRDGNRPFAEYRAIDPEGNWFDLSEHGFLPPHV